MVGDDVVSENDSRSENGYSFEDPFEPEIELNEDSDSISVNLEPEISSDELVGKAVQMCFKSIMRN